MLIFALALCTAANAQTKISALPSGTPATTDVVPYVADPAGTPATKKTTVLNFFGVLTPSFILPANRHGDGAKFQLFTGSSSTNDCAKFDASGNLATLGSPCGTVTSVGLSMPSEFGVSGSPVTGSGTITVTRATQAANTGLFGPTSGGAAAPAFRAMVNADLPPTLSSKTFDNTNTANFKGSLFTLQDATDTTKQARFDVSNVGTGQTRTVNIPDANSTAAQAKAAVSNQFLTSMSAQGVFGAAQPAFSDLSGSVAATQMPALTGDVTTGAGTVATTLANAGTPGTYTKVTTDAKGRVTTGTTLTSGDLPSHSHSGTDLTSGTVPTARLGSGTASSSTFLRGDQAYADPLALVGARVYHSATQALTSATPTALVFNSERFDTAALHDTASNTDRLTAPTAGYYSATCQGEIASNATGFRSLTIRLNAGGTIIAANAQNATNGDSTTLNVTAVYQLAAGDYVRCFGFQNAGVSLNVTASGNFGAEFSLVKIGN
jgi:hypothetical protein